MAATTIFLWMRVPAVKDCYASALIISGEVTFIAAYHYLRIFNSWVESYEYKPNNSGEVENPVLTGVPSLQPITTSVSSTAGWNPTSTSQTTAARWRTLFSLAYHSMMPTATWIGS